MLLEKVAMLWQIPNWTANNSVLLAEWVYETYNCEPLEVIIKCFQNPPTTDAEGNPILEKDRTWRLTPEVVTKWMAIQLGKESAKRERDLEKFKAGFKDKLPDVDYESFKKRLAEGTALKDNKPKHWKDDPKYQEFKQQRMIQNFKDDNQAEGTDKTESA